VQAPAKPQKQTTKPKGVLTRQERIKSSPLTRQSNVPSFQATPKTVKEKEENVGPSKSSKVKQEVTVAQPQPNRSENIENDEVMKRLRNIQQDIRQRRIKQQSQPTQPSQPTNNQLSRPSIQAAKSLDLTYYPLKPHGIVPKSAAVRIIQPNGSEPPPTKNRIRLIKANSKEDAPCYVDNPVVVNRPGPRSMATNGHRHTVDIGQDLSNTFASFHTHKPQLVALDSSTPMRSTYF